jgi:tripartite-type tricarboxylate transporter receptor subunit TctC
MIIVGENASRRRSSIGAVPTLAIAAALFAAAPVGAQTYPDKPIRLVVPGAPGGPTDMPARLASQFLPKLGQPAVIENRPGAGGAIGARAVAAAPPDGYTLLIGNTSVLAVIPAVSASAGYDPTRSLTPVAKFSESFQILVVHPSVPVKTVRELIDYAKANPGKLNYAHTGAGGLPHLTGELFLSRAGVNIVGVPYRSGGESVTAVLSEAVHMTFEGITILLPLIREGKVRALAVTSRTRTSLAPDLPTMIEAGVPDYEVTTFNGMMAPAGTPAAIVQRLNTTINEGVQAPDMQETITKLGAVTNPGTPEQFGAFIAAELAKWRSVAQAANVKLD